MQLSSAFYSPREDVVSHAPLILRRAVRWGECDPAGIVYTPRYTDYIVSAYQAFIGLMLGRSMHSAEHPSPVGFPVRGIELDFRQPMPVDTRFDMEVRVGDVRARTFDLHITAWTLDNDGERRQLPAFLARITSITIDKAKFESVALPDTFRSKIAAYAEAHSFML